MTRPMSLQPPGEHVDSRFLVWFSSSFFLSIRNNGNDEDDGGGDLHDISSCNRSFLK